MTFVISMTIALTTMGMAMAWSQRPVPSTYAGLIDKKNLVGFAHEAQLELRPDLGRWTETLEDGGLDVYVPLVAPGYAGAAIDLVGRFDEASEHPKNFREAPPRPRWPTLRSKLIRFLRILIKRIVLRSTRLPLRPSWTSRRAKK